MVDKPTTEMTPVAAADDKITAVDALVRILIHEGVQYMFGIPGSHTCALFDQVDRSGKIQIILTRHEQGAAYMADGYARVSRQVAVCSGTVGPGATNLLTGVAASYADGIPVIVITGQTTSSALGMTAHQESSGLGRAPNQVELFRNVTKTSLSTVRASKIPQLVRTAFRIALNGRFGPVNISIPADVYYDKVPFQEIDRKGYRVIRSDNVDPSLVHKAVHLIANAKRPIILAGQRSLYPDATDDIRELAEAFNIPVVTPLNAKGAIDEYHPLALGCLGLLGQPAGEKYLREVADVVIAVGENFEEWTSLAWDPEITRDRKLIHIDVDPLEIGKNYPVTLGIDGTIRSALRAIKKQLHDIDYAPVVTEEEIMARKEQWGYFSGDEMYSDAVPLKPQRVMHELREALPPETIVFGDSGLTVRWVGRFFKARPRSFYAANIFEPMGYGVAACIGGKLAAPDRPVVSICGDGSFLMCGMEVSTAVNYGIPVLWIIINDERLNMVYHAQRFHFGERPVATSFKNPDFVKFAESFGAVGFRAERADEIRPAVKAALDSGKPAILDIRIDPDEAPPYRPRAMYITRDLRLPQMKVNKFSFEILKKMRKEQ